MVRVLIVDDSIVVRELLNYILGSAPGLEVVGTATNGNEALAALASLNPDIITMDINMPMMDGFEATRRIMETQPKPIVIVSGSWNTNEVATTFRALEAGALAVVPRPPGIGHPDHRLAAAQLVQTVQSMAEVRVVRRWARASGLKDLGISAQAVPDKPFVSRQLDVVAVGASTGGPVVIQTLLKSLPADFNVPVLIVQHMAAGFIQGFVEWLAQTCDRPVLLGGNGVKIVEGHCYVAPDGHQMGVDRLGRIVLTDPKLENGFAPSVSFLFRSVAKTYGARAAGVLLTGMGADGAVELRLMRDAGGMTFAQDRESAVIYGMPGEAERLGAAHYLLPPQRIAAALVANTDLK